MDTTQIRNFAQYARRYLLEQVSSKLSFVLSPGSSARREFPSAISELERELARFGSEQLIDRIAYIWFNRFCALRFMDVHNYNRVKVVSPADPGQFQPEILSEAKMGHIDENMIDASVRQRVFSLLDGKAASIDPQSAAYRLLVVAVCNYWSKSMPFLFQRIDDYTELLMPDDLLSGNSILAYTREAMTPELCGAVNKNSGGVEIIGWLYQFYISEKKDEVFEGLRKNKKITPENIPAATQLFTPHWIVRYLVENSLGRLWMLNRPDSKLVEQMEYYVEVASGQWPVASGLGEVASGLGEVASGSGNGSGVGSGEVASGDGGGDFLRISSPEELKICDPACGSGHMLTYAFDLLYSIYEEEGYNPAEIPEKILTHNLYGIEIDERAGELAAFALTMKARAKQRRFFSKGIIPNICVLQNIEFAEAELSGLLNKQWTEISNASLDDIVHDLHLFSEADNFGSLLTPKLEDQQSAKLLSYLQENKESFEQQSLFAQETLQKIKIALKQANYLSQKYQVVIANPPYMGGRGMNQRMGTWLRENYEPVKSDLFSAFIVRNTKLAIPKGQLGFMTPFVWMFISSYEKLRLFLLNEKTITSLIQLEYSGFDGATVPICTFTIENAYNKNFKGGYVRLSDFKGADQQGPRALEIIQAVRSQNKKK